MVREQRVVKDELKLSIGGKPITVPPLSFRALKLAMPVIARFAQAPDRMSQCEAVFEIYSIALKGTCPDMSAEVFGDVVLAGEAFAMVDAFPDLLRISGLVPSGEAKPEATSSQRQG
jgi:hypothetical protein